MLEWSITLCRLRGIALRAHVTFLALLAYFAWEGWSLAGWIGLRWLLGYVVAVFTCVTLHELGHVFTARHFGVRVPRILLLPIGGMAEFERIPREPRTEILIALAGPAVNLVLLLALAALVGWPPTLLVLNVPFHWGELAHTLIVMNGVMLAFNLIPVFPMDGGRVLRAVLSRRMPYLRATRWAAHVAKVLAVPAAVALAYYAENYLAVVLFAFIVIAGESEYRTVRRQDAEDAYWRKRFTGQPPPATPALPPPLPPPLPAPLPTEPAP